jgi:hypothetical protein
MPSSRAGPSRNANAVAVVTPGDRPTGRSSKAPHSGTEAPATDSAPAATTPATEMPAKAHKHRRNGRRLSPVLSAVFARHCWLSPNTNQSGRPVRAGLDTRDSALCVPFTSRKPPSCQASRSPRPGVCHLEHVYGRRPRRRGALCARQRSIVLAAKPTCMSPSAQAATDRAHRRRRWSGCARAYCASSTS